MKELKYSDVRKTIESTLRKIFLINGIGIDAFDHDDILSIVYDNCFDSALKAIIVHLFIYDHDDPKSIKLSNNQLFIIKESYRQIKEHGVIKYQ